MEKNHQNFIEKLEKVIDLAENICKCSDPENKEKGWSIAKIAYHSCELINKNKSLSPKDNTLNNRVSKIIDACKDAIPPSNVFLIDAKKSINETDINPCEYTELFKKNIDENNDEDKNALSLLNILNNNSIDVISESNYDKGLERIKKFDIDMLTDNNKGIDKHHLQSILRDYDNFIEFIYGILKKLLKQQGRISNK